MKKKVKRLSLILALIMMLSLLPSFPSALALSGTASYKPVESNIAVKSWVSATANSNPTDAGLAIDGDPNTAWIALDESASLTVDLGGTYDAIRKTEVVFAGNQSIYKYKLEGSTDGEAWFTLADRTDNTKVAEGFTDIFSKPGIRYLRLAVTGGSPVGVKEFKIINYLRDNMKNGSDMSELGAQNTTSYYYNAGNNPPMPGYRGGVLYNATEPFDPALGNNIFGLVKDMGWAVNRLRIWNNPTSTAATNCSPANTARLAKYVVGAGLELAIDFHYADTWADPQSQPKPAAWFNLPFDELVKALHDYTYDTIAMLVEQDTAPTIVAIGNEISNGFVWGKEWNLIPGARNNNNPGTEFGGGIIWRYWHEDEVTPEQYQEYLDSLQRCARLVDAGIKAIREVNEEYGTKIETEIHCAFNVVEGNVNTPVDDREKLPRVRELVTQLSSRLAALGSHTDRFGISYYPDWHGSWGHLEQNIEAIREILPTTKLNISECSPRNSGRTPTDPNVPSGWQPTVQSQGDDFAKLMQIMCDIPNNLGQGVWSWGGTGSFQYGPVNFTTSGTNREPFASMKVFNEAFATGVVESGVYVTTTEGAAPVLPATVKELTIATGAVSDVAVTWDEMTPASFAAPGTFEVTGIATAAGNMNEVTAYVTVLRDKAQAIPDQVSRIDFNEGWQFLLATRTPSNATGGFATNGLADPAGMPTTAQIIDTAFDDSAWRTVKVPHDFSIEGPKVSSGSGSQNYLQGGLGWYRKTFVVPESMKDMRVQLDFEGVYQNSNVYVNGELVGNYPSGYTGFTYDITEYLTYGEDAPNVVVVKVQNQSPSGRWYTGSGITRPVTLVVTGQTRFLRNGVVITTPTIEADYKADKSAEVKINAEIRSDASNSNIWLVNKVYDANGALKAQHTSEPQPMNPSSVITLDDVFTVGDINLWKLDDPYRYTVVTELYYLRDGSEDPAVLVDSVTNKIGFHWFKIDNDEGAYLNDVYFKFQGVDLHHDDGALGAAGTYDAVKRKIEILKSMGVNAYRTSHNPPNKAIIDACSELGVVVMEEAFDGWGSTKSTNDFGLFWFLTVPQNWKGSLKPIAANTPWSEWVIKEMVGRDINEPSVVMWSIGNEVRGTGTRPSWYDATNYKLPTDPGTVTSTTLNEYTEALRLRNAIKSIDTTRYITMGGDQERTPPSLTSSPWGLVNQALDGYGLNYNTAASVDGLHNTFANYTFFFESESSSQTGVRGVYFDAPMQNTPANQTPGSRGVSSYDNNFSSWTMPNEYGLKKDRDRKYFLGQFIWSGFDYLGEPTPYGVYPMGHSNFGCIDTAGFPKDSYYLYRSQWLKTEHTTHIVPMNWTDWAIGENVEVWVNTDGYSAELFLNGESLGVKSFDEKTTTYGLTYYETTELTKDARGSGYGLANERSTANPDGYTSPNGSHGKLHLTWNVPFTPGELKAVAKDKAGNVIGEDVVKTAGNAYTTKVTPYKTVVKADGNSLIYYTVEVVDENGTMLPSARNILNFSVTNGMIMGVDSGWPGITDLYKYGNVDRSPISRVHAWNGKALVIVEASKNPGLVTLRTTSEDLIPTTCSVLSTEDGKGEYTSTTVLETLGAAVSASLYYGDALTVPVGSAAALPVDAEVTYASGAKILKKVVWPAIPSSQFAAPGNFNITGTVADTSLTVTASVTVAAAARTNIALNTTVGAQDFELTDTSGPLATATFTAGTNYPNYMLNGNTTNNWNNRASGSGTVVLASVTYSKPYEFVQVYWKGYQSISEVDLYFTLGSSGPSNNLPASIGVQYWDGFAWVDAANQKTAFATASNEASAVTFDPVLTSKVRVCLKNATPYSATTGAFTIVKFEVYNTSEGEVTLPEIVSLAPAAVATQAGTAPVLPATVVATYDDGNTGEVSVVWDAVDPASYAQAGTFTVSGAVSGTDIKALANVTVTPAPKPDILLNKSFETGTSPWMLRNADTGAVTALTEVTGTNYYRRNDQQNVHGTGTYAVNYSVTGAFSGYSEMYQDITVGDEPGIYTLSAWAQGSTTGSGILEIFAEADGKIYREAFEATGWRNWVSPTIPGILITDTARVGIRITYGNGSWYWIDEFDLVKTAELGAMASLIAPEILDTVTGESLNYGVSVRNVTDANIFEISAQFDSDKLLYLGSTIDLPAELNPTFFMNPPTFDSATGEYNATVVLLKQGAVLTAKELTRILTVHFGPKSTVKNNEVVDAGLTSVKVFESETETTAREVDALLIAASAQTVITNHLRWDIDLDGAITMKDISIIILNYYLAQTGDNDWDKAKVFDANNDGIVDLIDLLIITSYI